ncbi:MAG TPA: hypothetical protein VHP83_17145 [Aggregatilineaceae bacterium]|nr:hypothetical protein [Aggregatilineaceae bacterium]
MMIEIVPDNVDSALLYFHTRASSGNEITPFIDDLRRELPHTYIWAGDGGISPEPLMGEQVSYATENHRFWFVFPMHGSGNADFAAMTEAVGAVLVTCGGYMNTFVDQIMARFQLPASRVVLCGHQHGGCVALAAAMMRRHDPFALTVLFDPWPLEALYLQHEQHLPPTQVFCIDNQWVRDRETQRGAETPLYQVLQRYGIHADGVTLPEGKDQPDQFMFSAAAHQIKARLSEL